MNGNKHRTDIHPRVADKILGAGGPGRSQTDRKETDNEPYANATNTNSKRP